MAEKRKFEVRHSSLYQNGNRGANYEKCRNYACEDIVRNLTRISGTSDIVEIPKGEDFHFIGRIDTNIANKNTPQSLEDVFSARDFVGFSTINRRNISRYKGGTFFIYDIFPEDIAHVFPIDSSTNTVAECEEELAHVPSLWLTLNEL